MAEARCQLVQFGGECRELADWSARGDSSYRLTYRVLVVYPWHTGHVMYSVDCNSLIGQSSEVLLY